MTTTAAPWPDDLIEMSQSELADLRRRRLRAQTALLARSSPFYSRLLAGLGVTEVADPADLALVPPTTKADFLAAPEDFRLALGEQVPLEESTLAYLIYTTGTSSGRPAPLYITTSDDWAYQLHARRCSRILGLTGQETIANLFPLTAFPLGARIRADRTAAALGAGLVQGHTGSPSPGWPVHRRVDEAIDLVHAHRATVLWGISGFVRRFVIRAAERGVPLDHVRWCFVTGEATSPARLADLRDRLAQVGAGQARVVDRYGSTEGWSMVACDGEHGWHNPTPEEIYVEAVDPVTHQPVPDGAEGRLLITHLRARGTALLRYAVGDIVRLTRERCPGCGRIGERLLTSPLRTGALTKVNGTLVNTTAVAESLVAVPGLREWRVVAEHTVPGDELSGDALVVEIAPEDGRPRDDDLVRRVAELAHARAHLSVAVRVVAADDIFDPTRESKPRRFVDRRAASRGGAA
ncbi:MAG TPA: AMP-binding protein [Cellulomonas sp.]